MVLSCFLSTSDLAAMQRLATTPNTNIGLDGTAEQSGVKIRYFRIYAPAGKGSTSLIGAAIVDLCGYRANLGRQ
jgi:hypothetical protein